MKARAVGMGVLAVLALAVVWARADAEHFNPGDTVAVTAEVTGCGRLDVEAGGERWSSEDQHLRSGEGAVETGTLLRHSHNQARFTSDVDGLVAEMQRIRDDYFWPLGCIPPGDQS